MSDRQKVARVPTQSCHGLLDPLTDLAHIENEIRLSDETSLGCHRDDTQGSSVPECGPDSLEDLRYRFEVVYEDLRVGIKDLMQHFDAALGVVDEQFDARARTQFAGLAAHLGIDPGGTVRQVVMGYPGDRDVVQAQMTYGFGYAL